MGSGSSAHAELNSEQATAVLRGQAALKTCFGELQKQEINRQKLEVKLKEVERALLPSADQKDAVAPLIADLAFQSSANVQAQARVQTALVDLEVWSKFPVRDHEDTVPDTATVPPPSEVVRALHDLRQALLDRPGSDDKCSSIHRHLLSLAPYLADSDVRVRLAVVEAVRSIGNMDSHTFHMPVGSIQTADVENLHKMVVEEAQQNVVHYAASQSCPNALCMLATGVDWALNPSALIAKEAQGRNVAHLAAEHGHIECLAMMVSEEKLPRSAVLEQDSLGRTVLHSLALRGDAEGLQLLVKLLEGDAAELCTADHAGNWPQHLAAAGGFSHFVGLLVTHCRLSGASLAQPDGEGQTLAHLAARRGDVEMMRYLVETCNMPLSVLELPDHWYRTPVHHAVMADALELLVLLQEYGASLHSRMGPTQPQLGAVAIVNPRDDLMIYLPEAAGGPRLGRVHFVNRGLRLRFQYEQGKKEQEAIELERCDLAPTPLLLAEKFERKKAREFLSNLWAPIAALSGLNKLELMDEARRGALPAGVLAAKGAFRAIEQFVERGLLRSSDLVKRDGMGRSCLHWAASSGVPKAVNMLLKFCTFQEEDVLAIDTEGWSTFHHAAFGGSGEIMKVLLELCPQLCAGPDLKEALTVTDHWARMPLHVAAEAGSSEVIEVLAERQVPLHMTMGRPELQDGTITFAASPDLSGHSEDEDKISLGRVLRVLSAGLVSIQHKTGLREGVVEHERCTFSPTAIVLADRRNKSGAVQTLFKVAWQPFIKAVATCAASVGADVWDSEELRSHFRAEALKGARPVGALLMVKSQAHPVLLKKLIESEVITPEELLVQDMLGRSCLHRAAASGQGDTLLAVKELSAASDEDLEIKDIQGRNLLHHAVLSDDAETVRLAWGLLPGLFDDLKGDFWHMAPIHLAASIGALNAIKVLVELGARMDQRLGPTKLEEGSVVLVEPRDDPSGAVEEAPRLAMVRGFTGSKVTVKFQGVKAQKVSVERCQVAPTAQVLAEKFRKQVFVTLLSGRSCGCSSSSDRTVSELKAEAERKLGVSIKTLIGPDYQVLDLQQSLAESQIEPGLNLTAVLGSAPHGEDEEISEREVDEETKESEMDPGALHDPKHFIDFLITADVRLVRLEFLLELQQEGLALPRRQEAETMRTKGGATALVELQEYRRLQIDEASGHVSLDAGLGGQMVTVHFRSVSHMWESMEHPDPWRYQLSIIADMYQNLLGSGLVWVFIDVMSLYQYRRNPSQEISFQSALRMMHMLYSHEVVEVDILEHLTPDSMQEEGSVLTYDETTDCMRTKPIWELRLNPTPHGCRGWCQAEKEWARLRNMVQGTGIPTPPELFRKRMTNMKFTHRNDAEQVFELQAKVFNAKISGTTHLHLENLTAKDLDALRDAMPSYKHLKYVVVNGNALSGREASALIESGAMDIQMESCDLTDDDAVMIAEGLIKAVHLKSVSFRGNRIGHRGLEALREAMEHRPDLQIAGLDEMHREMPAAGGSR